VVKSGKVRDKVRDIEVTAMWYLKKAEDNLLLFVEGITDIDDFSFWIDPFKYKGKLEIEKKKLDCFSLNLKKDKTDAVLGFCNLLHVYGHMLPKVVTYTETGERLELKSENELKDYIFEVSGIRFRKK
jgi:hypothetical protein